MLSLLRPDIIKELDLVVIKFIYTVPPLNTAPPLTTNTAAYFQVSNTGFSYRLVICDP